MSNNIGVKNNISVDIINKDGMVDQHIEGHNFISINMKKFGELALKGMLTNNKYYNNTLSLGLPIQNSDYELVDTLKCTDSTQAESPTSETEAIGNTVAYATLAEASYNTTGTQGSVSESQSVCDNKKAQFVCEWAENTGNGTFQSVMLTQPVNAIPEPIIYDYEEAMQGFCYGGGYAWSSRQDTNILLKLNSTTLQIEEEIDLTGQINDNITDITYYNGYLYILGDDEIYKYNISLGIATSLFSRNVDSITNDGTYLYLGSTYIYRYTFNGVFVDSLSIGSSTLYGLTYLDGKFYGMSGYEYYIFDYSAGTVTSYTQQIVCNNGMGTDGNKLIAIMRYGCRTSSGNVERYVFMTPSTKVRNMFNRVLLPSPVTKNDTQTMKVTCTITFG